jgi:hypothetical protein
VGLPKSISGSSYAVMWNRLYTRAMGVNGAVEADDRPDNLPAGDTVPRLSNGEAAAVLMAWRRAASRSVVRWTLWYELVIYALGWRKAGDRFDDSTAHMKSEYPPEMTPLLWSWTRHLAEQLDGGHTVVRPLYIDTSRSGYEATEREAWDIMKRERAATGDDAEPVDSPDDVDPNVDEGYLSPGDVTPPGDILDTMPGDPQIQPVPTKTGGFPWWLIAVAAVILVGGGKKRRR